MHKPRKGRRIVEINGLGQFDDDLIELEELIQNQRKHKPKAKMPKRFTDRRASRG